jgi:hypothetical protein
MPTPIIIIAGKAGSGKDTVANYIGTKFNAVTLALADPMKRFVKSVFGFTDHQLWGPSEMRNAPSAFNAPNGEVFQQAASKLFKELFEEAWIAPDDTKYKRLEQWYIGCLETHVKDGQITPRVVLQTMGTEWGRGCDPHMWINASIRFCKTLLEGGMAYTKADGLVYDQTKNYDYAIITDARFRSEVLGGVFEGGAVFRINRPSEAELKAGIAGHRSEKELDTIPEHFYTDNILNDSTLETLYGRVDDAMAVHFEDIRS